MKEWAETGRQEYTKEEFQEIGLPDLLPAPPNVRRQIRQEGIKIGASNSVEETSGKGLSTTRGKPLPYRPPSLVNKGRREAKWRQPDIHSEAFLGIDHGSKWETFYPPYNNMANQQLRNELVELRMMVVPNCQPQARLMFRITYQKPYPEYVDEHNHFPFNFKMPAFLTFSKEDCNVSSRDHIFKFLNHCVAFEVNPNYKLRLFGNSMVGLAS
ncbi:hypothetical protein ACFXTN_020785 [Malus domestica]